MRLSVLWPSLRVTVIVAEPEALATGVKSRVPVEERLVYWTVGCGISCVLLEAAVMVTV